MYDDTILWKLLDGELPDAEAAAIESAASDDPLLRARVDELRTVKAAVLSGAPRPPADFADKVAAAVARPRAPVLDLDEAHRFLRRALVAAAVLAAVGLSYLLYRVVDATIEPPDLTAGPSLYGEPR